MEPARAAVDHLLLGTADLDRGIAVVEQLTGVRAVAGGSHPGRGTRNALLSLGGRQYLEIIAPDPQQQVDNRWMNLTPLREPRLIGWAAVTDSVDRIATKIRAAGHATAGARDGSRARPDGRLLQWRAIALTSGFRDGVFDPVPFFIQWNADSVHPSQDSPEGSSLKELAFEHPEPERLTTALAELGIAATVTKARRASLVATVSTRKGTVVLR